MMVIAGGVLLLQVEAMLSALTALFHLPCDRHFFSWCFARDRLVQLRDG